MTLKYAFRITHIDNIPYIEKYGITRADSPLRNPDYVSIGDSDVIKKRAGRNIKSYRLNEYIPFYLGPRSPMLYVIQHGYNGVSQVDAEQIVYCIIRLADIISSDKECIFSDGHALSALTKFYRKSHLPQIDEIVNYDDVYCPHWNSETDLDLKRRKEAELLVKEDIEPLLVCGYVVYDTSARQRLVDTGIPVNKIVVRPNYYF